MKTITLIFLLLSSSLSFANSAFEIPRSLVVELTDPDSQRVYPIFIKKPRSYKSKPQKRYPVIYMVDGSYSFQVISGATRFPMNSGKMEEAIIVAISYARHSRGSTSRVRDYTPVKATDWKMETGEANKHLKFISDVVIPHIESRFRTRSNKRTFVGNSLGGLFGTYILFNKPGLFDSYVLGSPSVWFANNAILSSNLATVNTPVKVWLSVGSLETPAFGEGQDMVKGATELASKITTQGAENLTLNFKIIDGASHATAFPTTAIQGINWIYGKR